LLNVLLISAVARYFRNLIRDLYCRRHLSCSWDSNIVAFGLPWSDTTRKRSVFKMQRFEC